jgi:hypothetical protein
MTDFSKYTNAVTYSDGTKSPYGTWSMIQGTSDSTIAGKYSRSVLSTGQPFTNINEKPNAIGYSYNGTDISNWGIAKYIIMTSGNTTINIPDWVMEVRWAMCGAGGAGGAATPDHNAVGYYNHHGHYFTYWGQLYYYDYQGAYYYQTSSGRPGAGGGAGGFVYHTSGVNMMYYLNIGCGSGGTGNGGHSYVTHQTTYDEPEHTHAYGGTAANKTTRGAGGSGSIQNGNPGGYISGTNGGAGGTQPRSTTSHGKGGNGTTGISPGSDSTAAGGNGNNGYVIVYLLSRAFS